MRFTPTRVRMSSAAPLAALLGIVAVAMKSSAAEPVRLTVAAAVELARAHSHGLQNRVDELDAAREREGQSLARMLPRVGTTLRYTRLSYVEPGKLALPLAMPGQPSPTTVQLGEAIENQYAAAVVVEQPIFTGFALWGGRKAAHHAAESAQHWLAQEELDVALRAEEAYFTALKADQMALVAAESVKVLDAHVASMTRLAQAGAGTALEVARSKTRLGSARLQLVHAQGAATMGRLTLATLLGLPPDTPLELVEGFDDGNTPPPGDLAELVSEARQRPDLAAAKDAAHAKEAQAKVAAAPLWPQVALRGSLQYDQPNQRYFPARNEAHSSWDASVVLSWGLWDWGATYRGARAAVHEAAIAQRSVEQLEEAVRLEVMRRLLDVTTAAERITTAEAAVDSAKQALQRAQHVCEAGQSSCLGVLDAEAELTRLDAERVLARADARIAWASLRRAIGAGPAAPKAEIAAAHAEETP